MDSLSGMTMFVAVAETRSFTKAASQFGVSSSAVGKSIARMEERLGCGCSTAVPAASP